MRRDGKQLLTREDWIRTAIDALAERGVAGMAVDRLAKTLGATRGSFYWHFADREALIDAVLEEWERETTARVVRSLETIGDPAERLRALFRDIYERPAHPAEIALASASGEPRIADAVARATEARLDFLRRIFGDLGLSDEEARARAWLAYAFYIGHHQLARNPEARPLVPPAGLDRIVGLLLSPQT